VGLGDLKWSQPMYSKSNISVVQAEPITKPMGLLIDKVSATSIAAVELVHMLRRVRLTLHSSPAPDFEKLVSDLQAQRNYLKAEGDRIQREIARYADETDTALASAKMIVESLGQDRKTADCRECD
jgi:hypothetical protein